MNDTKISNFSEITGKSITTEEIRRRKQAVVNGLDDLQHKIYFSNENEDNKSARSISDVTGMSVITEVIRTEKRDLNN
jgi:hypothetical protein